jgi:hypothetical protein
VTTICLCMIVRDEVASIERCLASCRDLIDHWVICDTGSVDGTPALVETALDGVPGELHHHEWRDFAHNRTLAVELARGKADYLLLLDADWTVEVQPGTLEDLTADAYMVRHAGTSEFHNKRLVSGALDWRYVGVTHEYITSPSERTCERLDGMTIHVHDIGGARTGRWERDIALLETQADPRSVYYLAQSLRDLGRHRSDDELLRRARETYLRRAGMEDGWAEEVYSAFHEAGALANALGDWPAAADNFLAAWESRPQRLEAVYDLAVGLRLRGHHHAAHRFTSLASGLEPLPVPGDDLFVAPWVYRWGLLFEYSISAFWTGAFDTSRAACDRLLMMGDELPAEYRTQTQRNRAHALRGKAARIGSRALGLMALPALLLGLAACGGDDEAKTRTVRPTILNTEKVERDIEQSIREQRQLSSRVSCPAGVEQKKDAKFECTATLKKGTNVFTVTQTDDKGNVTYVGR